MIVASFRWSAWVKPWLCVCLLDDLTNRATKAADRHFPGLLHSPEREGTRLVGRLDGVIEAPEVDFLLQLAGGDIVRVKIQDLFATLESQIEAAGSSRNLWPR